MKALLQAISFLLAFYGLVLCGLHLLQERFVFQPSRLVQDYRFSFSGSQWEELQLVSGEGIEINALYFRASQPAGGVVLYLHGNRGSLRRWARHHSTFTRQGYNFLIIDYRGFGKSNGRPSEEGLYADAEAAYRWLLERYPEEQVVLYGRSLGTAPASRLASLFQPRLAILETPFDNMPNAIRHFVPLPLPDWIFRLHFPNQQFLLRANAPVYIFAGTRDKVVPYHLSTRLRPFLPGEAHFITIEGGGHRNLSAFPEYHYHLGRILRQ